MNKITIGLKVSPDLKDWLQHLADNENRSLSSWILNALITYAKEHQNVDLKDVTLRKPKK
jgi:uncharacterized protein (DUF1778 family)